jgi:hypothetical protein
MNADTNQTGSPKHPPVRFLHEGLMKLRHEIRTYRRELPRLLAEGHEGRFVLIKGNEVLSVWDTFGDAHQAGRERFGMGEIFLAQPIDSRDLTRPFPDYLEPSATD